MQNDMDSSNSSSTINKIFLVVSVIEIYFLAIFSRLGEEEFYFQSYVFSVLVFVTFAAFLILWFMKKETYNKFSLDSSVIIFIIAVILLIFTSFYRYASFADASKIISAVLISIIIANAVETVSDFQFLVWSIVGIGLLLGGIGMISYFSIALAPNSFIAKYSLYNGFVTETRVSSVFQYPNAFGGFLLVPLFASFGLFLKAKGRNRRIATYAISIFLGFVLYLANSRGALIAFVLGSIIFFVIAKKEFKKTAIDYTFVILGTLVLIFINSKTLAPILQSNLSKLKILVSFFLGKGNTSLSNRIELAKDAVKIFLHHPIFGTGLGTFRYVMVKYRPINGFFAIVPHSVVFRFLAETGIVGTGAFLFLLYRGILSGIKSIKEQQDFALIGLFVGSISMFLHMCLDVDFLYPLLITLLTISLFAVSFKGRTKINKNKTQQIKILNAVLSLFLIAVVLFMLVPKAVGSVYAYRGKIEQAKGSIKNEFMDYISASQFDSKNAYYHYKLADIYKDIYFNKNLVCLNKVSVKELQNAMQLNPINYDYPFLLAKLYLGAKDENAVPFFKKAVNENPTNSLITADLGLAYVYTKGDIKNAAKFAEKSLQMNKDESYGFTTYGFINLKNRNFDKAHNLFNTAISKNNQNGFAYLGLATCYKHYENKEREIENLFLATHATQCLKEGWSGYTATAPLINIAPIGKSAFAPNSKVTLNWSIINAPDIIDRFIIEIHPLIGSDSSRIEIGNISGDKRAFSFVLPKIPGRTFRIMITALDKYGIPISQVFSPELSER